MKRADLRPRTVVRIRTTHQLAEIVDTIAGVGAGPDARGALRIPVHVLGTTDNLHLFAHINNMELVGEVRECAR